MHVYVKTPNGKNDEYEVEPLDTVEKFRSVISNKVKTPVTNILLFFAGKQLEEGNVIQDYSIIEKSTIYMAFKEEI